MGHHPVHAVADGGDARDGAREAVRPVPRAGAARLRRQAGALDRRPPAAGGGGGRQHRVHGHRRQVPQEVPRHRLPRLQADRHHLLHHDLRLRPLRPLPAPQLQLHLRRLPGRRRHVPQLLHHRLGRHRAEGKGGGGGVRRQGAQHRRHGVQLLQRPGGRGLRLRRPQRGAGDPGHHPLHAGEAIQGPHVEGGRRRLPRRRPLLLPRRPRRLLGLRQRRRRQHPHHPLQAPLAHRHGQHDGRRPRHRQLPDLCHASVRHDRNSTGEEAPLPPWSHPSPDCPYSIRCLHHARRHHLPFLRRAARLLRRICVCPHNLLPPLRHVAGNLQAEEVQLILVYQLDLHHTWSASDAHISHRWPPADHHPGQDLQVLLVSSSSIFWL